MPDPHPSRPDSGVVVEEARPEVKQPPLYQVVLLNDDYTPMEFVVQVLERIFDMDHETATRIMLQIHNEGIGSCGIYPYDAAKAKVAEVLDYASNHQHPLQCVLECTKQSCEPT